ncbi:MAG: ABC transporter ATP-binding protein [Acidimicrobiales bacterium]
MAQIVASDVTVKYGGVKALSGVGFSAAGGQAVGIIGPNGAGKSTFLNVLSGFHKPSAGSIVLDGKRLPCGRGYSFARAGVVLAWQSTRLFARLTVLENLLVNRLGRPEGSQGHVGPREMLGRVGDGEVEEGVLFLERMALGEHLSRYASDLSGGQRRLLELARAMWLRPRVLLLDEPSVGVAPAMRRTVMESLQRECLDQGGTVIVVEHELEVIEKLCQQVYVLISGEMVTKGSLSEVMRHPDVRRGYLGLG